MENIELVVEKRTLMGKKSKRLLAQGYVPGIIYGHLDEPVPVQVERRALRQALRKAGMSRLISLKIKGEEDRTHTVLIKDFERDPIRRFIRHVDFYEVAIKEKITAEVPIVLKGESPAVASGLGVLLHSLEGLEVECLPTDLPPEIEVDISVLKEVDDAIFVKDLKLPPGVKAITPPDEEVVRVVWAGAEMREMEAEEAAAAEAEAAEVEVVAKGKAAKEGEEE